MECYDVAIQMKPFSQNFSNFPVKSFSGTNGNIDFFFLNCLLCSLLEMWTQHLKDSLRSVSGEGCNLKVGG